MKSISAHFRTLIFTGEISPGKQALDVRFRDAKFGSRRRHDPGGHRSDRLVLQSDAPEPEISPLGAGKFTGELVDTK